MMRIAANAQNRLAVGLDQQPTTNAAIGSEAFDFAAQ
jgi:hypothetical protein